MNTFKLLSILFIWVIGSAIYSFPGDHNSLTCDKNFLGLSATIDGIPNTIITDTNEIGKDGKEIPNSGMLGKYYRKSLIELNDQGKINRAKIVAAINDDLQKPDSLVKANIRANQDATYEGKPLQITKWGDSLSDFVNFYGVLTPGALGEGSPTAPIGGIYGGDPLWIDSWSDYFSIFGQPPLVPVYVRNHGIATYETTGVMRLMGFSSYHDQANGWWDVNSNSNKCPMGGPFPTETKVSDWL